MLLPPPPSLPLVSPPPVPVPMVAVLLVLKEEEEAAVVEAEAGAESPASFSGMWGAPNGVEGAVVGRDVDTEGTVGPVCCPTIKLHSWASNWVPGVPPNMAIKRADDMGRREYRCSRAASASKPGTPAKGRVVAVLSRVVVGQHTHNIDVTGLYTSHYSV